MGANGPVENLKRLGWDFETPCLIKPPYVGAWLGRSARIRRLQEVGRRDPPTVSNEGIAQTALEGSEPAFVVTPLRKTLLEYRLADLLGACRVDVAFCLIELYAASLEIQSTELQDAPHVSLEILNDVPG